MRNIRPCIPPRENAVFDFGLNDSLSVRNEAVLMIHGLGGDATARKLWKKISGYHIRSLAETAMSRLKRTFGGVLFSRSSEKQDVELSIKAVILNMMTRTGMPKRCGAEEQIIEGRKESLDKYGLTQQGRLCVEFLRKW